VAFQNSNYYLPFLGAGLADALGAGFLGAGFATALGAGFAGAFATGFAGAFGATLGVALVIAIINYPPFKIFILQTNNLIH